MRVIWKSEERVIPGHGVATQDAGIDLPNALAKQFIEQGQAMLEEPVKRGDQKSRRTKDEGEVQA